MSKKSGGFLSGAILGGVAAAAAALLLTPKSGKEMRDDLTDQANDFKNRAIENGEEGKPDYAGQAAELMSTLKDKAVKGSEEAMTVIKKQTEELSNKIKATTDEMTDLAEESFDDIEEDIVIEIPKDDNLSELVQEVTEAEEAAVETVEKAVEETTK
ncbi:YtxH domain-containing protein [Vagococcus coleopterorum]|uniref:YtxH domain-containing protein n=1 Tax=Vagococcus coleopterorum TaxID=2714946 RepID=A0A6G8AP08_9ENTE|nr:YtxH domain-containing protein [Vagococcus coleopterorum]QIL46736.1 YtxH domain-containing protein [Vagococcus coleopterorum]